MPLDFNDTIEILDIEGNDIEEESNLDFLETMGNLQDLNISSNPICNIDEFRQKTIEKIKTLKYLNEVSTLIK